MFKLYKRLPSGKLAYHEAWESQGTIYDHFGEVGDEGETRELPVKSREGRTELKALLDQARRDGFAELDPEHRLIVEYPIDGMGTSDDVDKMAKLEYELNEVLGWTALGKCDGNSIGSGTMEVCCFVVDYSLAKSVIVKGLAGTAFANYSRIYDEDDLSA